MDEKTMAEILYPTMQAEQEQKDKKQEQQAAAPAAMNELALATEMYSEQSFKNVTLHDPTEHMDKPLAEVTELNEQHRDDLWAIQVSEPQADELTTMLRAAMKNPPSEEQRAEWHKQTTESLVARHGQEGARQRLVLMQKFMARSPRLAKQIAESGLGSHPRVAEVAHELAWSQRAKGLL